jgi:predicted GNAT superfamily acetyltransferase
MLIRKVNETDYKNVISVIDEWWGGRHMAEMLPKLFFVHFQNTSFIAEENSVIVGFLVGFISQTYPDESYIHFVGVHPAYRKAGVAKNLYELFFDLVQQKGCDKVRCVTSPINKISIAFHTKLGFQIEDGGALHDGVSVHVDYDGQGGSRVLFVKKLST